MALACPSGGSSANHGEALDDKGLAAFRGDCVGNRPGLPVGTGRELLRLFQGVAHFGEHRADLRADILDSDNDEDRDQARDQRIFDRRHARFIAKEVYW
jgi:hypothetical protein